MTKGTLVELVYQLLGFGLGLASGFFFERRATRATRGSNDQLRAQLERLREANERLMAESETQQQILVQLRSAVSAVRPPTAPGATATASGLSSSVHRWLKINAGPDGAVANGVARAKSHFAAVGSNAVDQAIAELVAAGRVRTDGKEVRAT